jgi:hypothetical protein
MYWNNELPHSLFFGVINPCSFLVLGFFMIPWVVLAKIIVSLMESGTCGDVTGVCLRSLLDLPYVWLFIVTDAC